MRQINQFLLIHTGSYKFALVDMKVCSLSFLVIYGSLCHLFLFWSNMYLKISSSFSRTIFESIIGYICYKNCHKMSQLDKLAKNVHVPWRTLKNDSYKLFVISHDYRKTGYFKETLQKCPGSETLTLANIFFKNINSRMTP